MKQYLIDMYKIIWLILAIPCACGLILCSFMANGYTEAKQYAKEIGLI